MHAQQQTPPATDQVFTVPLTVALDYDAPADCPTAMTFVRGLQRLSDAVQVRVQAPNQGGASARVRIVKTDGRFVGEFLFEDSQRSIQAPVCADAAYALALIAAITFDPQAEVSDSDVNSADFEAPKQPRSSSGPSLAPPGSPQTKPALASSGAVEPSGPDMDAWDVDLGGFGAFGELQGWMPGAIISVFHSPQAWYRGFDVGASLGIGSADIGTTTLNYTRLSVSAAWCPRIGAALATVQVFGCAGLEGGAVQLRAQSTATLEAAPTRVRQYWAAVAGVRVRLRVSEAWGVVLHPYATVPLRRDSYVIETIEGAQADVIQHAVATGGLALKVSYEF